MPIELEYKNMPIELKALTEVGELEGYCSVKHNVDRVGDVIEDGAYVDLDSLVKDGFGAISHNWYGLPIGTVEEARETDKGLYFKMQFHSHPEAQAARTVVKERFERGKSVLLSIGYEVIDSAYETRDGREVRVLKKIKVYEPSIVTVPANPKALATGVKGLLQDRKSLDDHIALLLAGNKDLLARVRSIKQMRERGLAEDRVLQLKELRDQLSEIILESEPIFTGENDRLLKAIELAHQSKRLGLI